MAIVWNSVKQASRLLWQPVVNTSTTLSQGHRLKFPLVQSARLASNYKPYPEYEETPSPFKPPTHIKHGYKYKYYKGGLLPRPKGEYENMPVKGLPAYKAHDKDQWTPKKALFGQNDYIDILGDGTIHPAQLCTGPAWVRAYKGNELQRLIRRLNIEGKYLREYQPSLYHSIRKQIYFLYKRLNQKRRHAPFWSRGHQKNRIEHIHNRTT